MEQRLLEIIGGEKPYKCNFCDYSCKWSHGLQKHELIRSGEQPFKCHICGYYFKRLYYLNRHQVNHRGEKPYKCNICDYLCKRSDYLKKHKLIYSGVKPCKCYICDYSFGQLGDLKIHQLTHSGEKPLKCNIYDVSYIHLFSSKRHKLIHSGEKPNICEFSIKRLSTLKVHNLNHCKERGNNLTRARKVKKRHNFSKKKHLSAQSSETLRKCVDCNYYTKPASILQYHLSKHCESDEFKCPLCGTQFKSCRGLKHHVLDHNGEALFFKFVVCNSTFKQKVLATQHFDSIHQENID